MASLIVAGCTADDDDAATGDRSTDRTTETVTIEHAYGSTEAPVDPPRIVSLDTQWTDVLIAMEHPPVGYIADPNLPDGNFPWRGNALDGTTAMTAIDQLPWEQIAALQPDLIVVSYFARDRADYDRLDAIAPTIAARSTDVVETWQDIARVAGEVLGDPARAEAVISEVGGNVADLEAEMPGLRGKTFALVNFVPGDSYWVVSDPQDAAAVVFDQIGMSITPTILAAGSSELGRAQLSLEQTSMLDADLLVVFTNGASMAGMNGFDRLPAARTGAVVELDYAQVSGLNTPTPLSIPYALDAIRPALEAAAT